ncbi:zinc-ribbon domain-containing protein [Aquimarina sp. 2201CG14-23]|uniref:zinc-ribbon domain-containing protein n=1 Tax=Aquimarina mycalae TaxID=3040073 RepID=UPI002477DA28|nr:zinc-ribbon domain-containing protein [Aquimarina sp. 2201CG14-23]MDH7448370.1 zinc-ribbon domain-containing protein [Aquimarina sp. 2201CG14-23]
MQLTHMEEIAIQQPLCSQCSAEITSTSKFCTHCGFPENGDEKEKAVFHAKKAMKKNEIMDDHKRISSARNTLYWIAGINLVLGFIHFFASQDIASLIVQIIVGAIYLVLAYWSQKKPFAAILSGLLFYLTMIAILAIAEPATIFSGILFKIIIIAFLAKGVYSASQNSKE